MPALPNQTKIWKKQYWSDKKVRATTQFPEEMKRERIAINTKELQAMLGCGRKTAVDIGEQAGAKIQIGRRILWNPVVIKAYVAQISL